MKSYHVRCDDADPIGDDILAQKVLELATHKLISGMREKNIGPQKFISLVNPTDSKFIAIDDINTTLK